MTLSDLTPLIQKEMNYGMKNHGFYHTAHEQESVLREEYTEWWDEVRADAANTPKALYELIQVAAVALRYIIENGDAESIANVQRMRHERKDA